MAPNSYISTYQVHLWYWQIYLLISPSIQGDFGGRMSKSSSYKQGPSLVARQSKGYSGDRSHTASGYPHSTPLALVRAELLRAAVVVELRGRGAAHQPRLQQVLPGGVGQQQRVPLQHSRPGR